MHATRCCSVPVHRAAVHVQWADRKRSRTGCFVPIVKSSNRPQENLIHFFFIKFFAAQFENVRCSSLPCPRLLALISLAWQMSRNPGKCISVASQVRRPGCEFLSALRNIAYCSRSRGMGGNQPVTAHPLPPPSGGGVYRAEQPTGDPTPTSAFHWPAVTQLSARDPFPGVGNGRPCHFGNDHTFYQTGDLMAREQGAG
jgi:hypothetical protein